MLVARMLNGDIGADGRTFFGEANRKYLHHALRQEVVRITGMQVAPQSDDTLQLVQYGVFNDLPG